MKQNSKISEKEIYLNAKITSIIKGRYWTNSQVSEKIGMPASNTSAWLNGKLNFSFKKLDEFAKKFDIEIETLIREL